MKKIQIAGFTALTLLGSLSAVQAAEATTSPVGYVTLASASNPIPANTDVRLSVPMEASVDFTGLATSATLNDLTVAGAAFTVDEFAPATGGYYLRIKSGTLEDQLGQTAEIISNTADTLTVAFEDGDDFSNVDATTQIEIVKYFTLSTFFPSDLPNETEVFLFNNTTESVDLAPNTIVVNYSGIWYDKTNNYEVIDASLYPGESFILRNNSASPIENIVITGNVPTISHRIVMNSISGSKQDYSISYLSPIAEVIGNSSLGFNEGDELYVYNRAPGIDKAPAVILAHYSGVWYDKTDNFKDVTSTFSLQAGVGYVYRKSAGSPISQIWNNVQTYNITQP